jgi:predicted HTH transcriptional regulator
VASPSELIHSGPAANIDFDLVREFVLDAEATNMFTESLTFEAKERRDGNNVVDAVAALSNTDGGIVLVGVRDKDAVGADRLVGYRRLSMIGLLANSKT